MTVRERILALRLLEKQESHPEYLRNMGIRVYVVRKEEKKWR